MEELRLKDIIVIDDNEHDLNSIVKALRAEKQFVIPVHFTDENSSNMDILESYITSNKVIRCVISDINIIEVSTYQPSTAAKHLADNVLSRFLSKERVYSPPPDQSQTMITALPSLTERTDEVSPPVMFAG